MNPPSAGGLGGVTGGGVCSGAQARSEARVTSQARPAGPARATGPADPAGLGQAPGSAGPVSIEARRWLDGAAVERPVLELRPDYTALIIVAEGLRPGPSDEASDALLRDAEAQAKTAMGARDLGELAPVAAWRAAYQAFGAKPKRTRPSVEALLRRVEAGLPRIDRLTDIYNAISVRHPLPVGGGDLRTHPRPVRRRRGGRE